MSNLKREVDIHPDQQAIETIHLLESSILLRVGYSLIGIYSRAPDIGSLALSLLELSDMSK